MNILRIAWVVVSAAAVAAILFMSAGDTRAQTERLIWARLDLDISPAVELRDIYMLDSQNAWAVGTYYGSRDVQGHMYRLERKDGHWRVVDDPRLRQITNGSLNAVVAISNDNVWAVGDNGLVVHVDRSGWQVTNTPNLKTTLDTLQMFGNGDEGWAGGREDKAIAGCTSACYEPVMLHYTGGQWQRAGCCISGFRQDVTNLHFVTGAGYAVGRGAWRYNNGTWAFEQSSIGPARCSTRFPACNFLQTVRTRSSDEAWAAGYRNVTDTTLTAVLLHRQNGAWSDLLPGAELRADTLAARRVQSSLQGMTFSPDGYGIAVGWQSTAISPKGSSYIMSYRGDRNWYYDEAPFIEGSRLVKVSNTDATHALAVGNVSGINFVLSFGYGGPKPAPWPVVPPSPTPTIAPPPYSTPPPTARFPDPHRADITYFALVGHTLWGGFRDYWQAHGGLGQFGYPITEEFDEVSPTDGRRYTVQYFERARFEWHPKNNPPYDVLLGLLGNTITTTRRGQAPFQPATPSQEAGAVYFQPTRHNGAPQFVEYWRSHGGLPVFGYPISEPFVEASQADGRPYLVQYFERNRLEYHPELPEAYRVSLGLLGTEVLTARGWLP
jgi:hypothetical protein